MKKVTIQAYEDRSRAEGGHAVILLHGLARPQGAVAFRVRPVDGTRTADGTGGWIGGEHTPVSVTASDQGLELVAGPGVTESEHLLPGTVVEIEVPACTARGEFLWPNIAPLMRPKRKSIVVNRQRGNGRPEPAAFVPAARSALETSPPARTEEIPAPRTEAAPPIEAAATASETVTAVLEPPEPDPGTIDLSPATPDIDNAGAAPMDVSVDEVPMKEKRPTGVRAGASDPQESTDQIATKYGWAFRKDVSSMLSKKFFALGASRHDDVQDEAVSTAASSAHHNIAAEATAILAHKEEEETASAQSEFYTVPAPAEYYQPAAEDQHSPGGGETFYRHARANVVTPTSHSKRPVWQVSGPRLSAGLVAGLATLIVGGIAGVALLSEKANIGVNDASATILTTAPAVVASAASKASVEAPANTLLFDALSVGATSPRGNSAAGITIAKALENANVQLLVSGAARDTEEGAFWLKQYIAGTFGDDRTVRVLTQLGSVYAEPTGAAPDYAKARLLWEISSAAGDPVAMCFLGLLHENGLGVSADKKSALQWYERSKAKGGCPNVDESLARVRQ